MVATGKFSVLIWAHKTIFRNVFYIIFKDFIVTELLIDGFLYFLVFISLFLYLRGERLQRCECRGGGGGGQVGSWYSDQASVASAAGRRGPAVGVWGRGRGWSAGQAALKASNMPSHAPHGLGPRQWSGSHPGRPTWPQYNPHISSGRAVTRINPRRKQA